jgi:hypothetical protein
MKPFLFLFLFIFTLQASAQSLADIARRERERQKQTGTQNKGTYTNATAAGAAAAPSQPVATPAAPEKPAEKKEEVAAKPTGATDSKGRDEKYWRDAFKKARDVVRQADDKVQLQEARLKELNTQLLRQSDIYNKENVLGPIITQTQKDLEAAKADAEQARNNVTKLEDELRASGGLPGWAR